MFQEQHILAWPCGESSPSVSSKAAECATESATGAAIVLSDDTGQVTPRGGRGRIHLGLLFVPPQHPSAPLRPHRSARATTREPSTLWRSSRST
eukprot:4197766-Prymnesium_polylepis.1